MNQLKNKFYNEDCIIGAKKYIPDNSIDLIIADPPYGIEGDQLHKHYNRNEEFVIDGYVEVPKDRYLSFSKQWIKEAERVLKPGGSIYIVSGYSNLKDILIALDETKLKEVNHIIWKYNFGVYTKTKFVSSHYHILFYVKPGKKHTFNTFCRYSPEEKDSQGRSLNYKDREDVWIINREYQPKKIKNKNELPTELLTKIIMYSSNEGDLVCDFFLGSFKTAKVALGLNRNACGFELNKSAFDYQMKEISKIKQGYLLKQVKTPKPQQLSLFNQGKPWTDEEKENMINYYLKRKSTDKTKKEILNEMSEIFGRGYFSLLNMLNKENL